MKKHEKEMTEHQIPQPSREEFNALDINSDGIVTDAEWKKFAIFAAFIDRNKGCNVLV